MRKNFRWKWNTHTPAVNGKNFAEKSVIFFFANCHHSARAFEKNGIFSRAKCLGNTNCFRWVLCENLNDCGTCTHSLKKSFFSFFGVLRSIISVHAATAPYHIQSAMIWQQHTGSPNNCFQAISVTTHGMCSLLFVCYSLTHNFAYFIIQITNYEYWRADVMC